MVTGGGRGIGRALVERLLGADDSVVAIELDPDALAWTHGHPAASRLVAVAGDAADEAVAEEAADRARAGGALTGWVNNAAVFRDASIHTTSAREVLDLIALNLDPAVVGCATAIRRFLAAGIGGAIVNVSSHQARRAAPGCLPYVTAKAAPEAFLSQREPSAAARVEEEMRRLHLIGRVGVPKRSQRPLPTCCQRMRASSPAPPCPSTADARSSPATPRPTPSNHLATGV